MRFFISTFLLQSRGIYIYIYIVPQHLFQSRGIQGLCHHHPCSCYVLSSIETTYLFQSSYGNISLEIFYGALLGQIVVDLSGAEEQFGDVGRVLSRWSGVLDDASELCVLRHLLDARPRFRQPQ